MSDFYDYLSWRGDLLFIQDPLNEVDGMILTRFTYIPLERIDRVKSGEQITVKEVYDELYEIDDVKNGEHGKFLAMISHSERFMNIVIHSFEFNFDPVTETQFCAMTFRISDNLDFVAYRGTDTTIVGWKEDFNMGFTYPVPGQLSAVRYYNRIAEESTAHFILGGHSKGGNFAVYAAAFCEDHAAIKIDTVYNYDGPGFNCDIMDLPGYKRIGNKIKTFVPQSSIIGMLLSHEENYIIVHSSQFGIMQHDTCYWRIEGRHFEYLDKIDNGSKFIDRSLRDWISKMSLEDRERLTNTLYSVLVETNLSDFKQMSEKWFINSLNILKSFNNLEASSRKSVTKALALLAKSAKNSAVQMIKNK